MHIARIWLRPSGRPCLEHIYRPQKNLWGQDVTSIPTPKRNQIPFSPLAYFLLFEVTSARNKKVLTALTKQ